MRVQIVWMGEARWAGAGWDSCSELGVWALIDWLEVMQEGSVV